MGYASRNARKATARTVKCSRHGTIMERNARGFKICRGCVAEAAAKMPRIRVGRRILSVLTQG